MSQFIIFLPKFKVFWQLWLITAFHEIVGTGAKRRKTNSEVLFHGSVSMQAQTHTHICIYIKKQFGKDKVYAEGEAILQLEPVTSRFVKEQPYCCAEALHTCDLFTQICIYKLVDLLYLSSLAVCNGCVLGYCLECTGLILERSSWFVRNENTKGQD